LTFHLSVSQGDAHNSNSDTVNLRPDPP